MDPFELDAAASEENHKCERYFTKADDALKKSWGGVQNMVQSTLRQADREVGTESCGNRSGRSVLCGHAYPGENRNTVVPRLHSEQSESAHDFLKRQTAVFRGNGECPISEHDSGFCVRYKT